jgi:hypothetical protein
MRDSIFVKLLKKHTDINPDFIDMFLKKFKIGGEYEFEINENDVVKYLKITKLTLRKRLNNHYAKKKIYYENVDYAKIKMEGEGNGLIYMLNYDCFERIAMSSEGIIGESVRFYFSKLRKFITENQKNIFQAMENKADDLKIYDGLGTIYFFAVDKRNFKIGKTKNIVKRLREYNVGRIKEIELKYLALVKNETIIEKCMKNKLLPYQKIKNREIYEIDPKKIKKIIDNCYCDNITKANNLDLYKEISNLLGMYAYIKDKINIKPFVIIDK